MKQHLKRYPYIGGKLCIDQCECVGIKNSSFTEEQVSWNMRIDPGRDLRFIGMWQRNPGRDLRFIGVEKGTQAGI